MFNLIRNNKKNIEKALLLTIASLIILPLVPLDIISDNQGAPTIFALIMMILIFCNISVDDLSFGSHKVTVKKIISPTSFIVVIGNESIPLNIYGVVAPHSKQIEAYKESLVFITEIISTGTVKIKSLPDEYRTKNEKLKFTRLFVDGVDVAEEALSQGLLWLDPNFIVPRSYRSCEDKGKTWGRGHYGKQKRGEIVSPFKFAMQEMKKRS